MGERLPCKQEVTSSNLVFSIRQPGAAGRRIKLHNGKAAACTLKTAYKNKEISELPGDWQKKTSEVM